MKFVKLGFCGAFLAIIFFFFVTTLGNDESVSKLEKRPLQTFPTLTGEGLLDGSYTEKLTGAFSDQLELRDLLVRGYYLFQFQRYNGDVVRGENGDLYAACQVVEDWKRERKRMRRIARRINRAAAEVDAEFIFLSIPRKDAVETENLPGSYVSSDSSYKRSMGVLKRRLSEDVTVIDAYEVFRGDDHKNRYFYKTDHHITPRAAELLYLEILEEASHALYAIPAADGSRHAGGTSEGSAPADGAASDAVTSPPSDQNGAAPDTEISPPALPVRDLQDYTIGKTIINGSFNDQLGQSVKSEPEELYITPKFTLDYDRYEDGAESSLSIWAEANTYEEAYMEGDHAYTVIDTGRKELPNILYVGSSFTNILEAMSVPSFGRTVSIDYRHNDSGNQIQYYVEKHDIDIVVFIPSQSNNALSPRMVKTHLGRKQSRGAAD